MSHILANRENMSIGQSGNVIPIANNKIRVMAFVDGFNLYHALQNFSTAASEEDETRYRKYKWLCLTSLVQRFIAPETEILVKVKYFTTYPAWDENKKLRHQIYVSAQKQKGVEIIFGEFKLKTVECRATCFEEFNTFEEKQTDINIAVAMIESASEYDKLILLTADSDQVPAVKLLRKLYPAKVLASLPPIGRKAKELKRACHEQFKMTEQHLAECQLPNPMPVMHNGRQTAVLVRPSTWA